MKKITIASIIILLIISISCKIFATDNTSIENSERGQEFALDAFKEWIEGFKSEEIPENRRITDYRKGLVIFSDLNSDKAEVFIKFAVTPVSKENTDWEYSEPEIIDYEGHKCILQDYNICCIEMSKINGQYQIDYISDKPKNYDKFLERFEEYKSTNPQNEENIQIQGQNTTTNLSQNQEIEKISNIVTIVCIAILALLVIYIFIRKRNMSSGILPRKK